MAACSNLGNGAHLATPRNSKQSQCVHEVRNGETVWLGMAKFVPFQYVDKNTTVENYFNWTQGQPTNIFNKRCAIAKKCSNVYGWESEDCLTRHVGHICQRKSSK